MPTIPPPAAMRSEQRDVTLLFADLRGFTALAAALETNPLVADLLGHVMDCLTEAVHDQRGHVVDYYGDGLVAMWNAPAEQPEHAQHACRAALRMLQSLPAVSAEWSGLIQADLRLGVGVHTGAVQVGNAGSSQQAKYGPRGANVHLASRVEAATKELGLPLLVTASTAERLPHEFAAHRVCRARLPGLNEPVDLYAVCAAEGHEHRSPAWHRYAQALQEFEAGRYDEAAALTAGVDASQTDVPWSFLAAEIERALGGRQRRRSTDKPTSPASGVVVLNVK